MVKEAWGLYFDRRNGASIIIIYLTLRGERVTFEGCMRFLVSKKIEKFLIKLR